RGARAAAADPRQRPVPPPRAAGAPRRVHPASGDGARPGPAARARERAARADRGPLHRQRRARRGRARRAARRPRAGGRGRRRRRGARRREPRARRSRPRPGAARRPAGGGPGARRGGPRRRRPLEPALHPRRRRAPGPRGPRARPAPRPLRRGRGRSRGPASGRGLGGEAAATRRPARDGARRRAGRGDARPRPRPRRLRGDPHGPRPHRTRPLPDRAPSWIGVAGRTWETVTVSVHDTQNPETREDALAAAVDAVRGGGLIVLPTDTVYGIGADAFTPQAVQDLLEAKGRGRDTPPPVLIGDHAVLMALATDLPEYVEDLAEALWPGALTIILTAQPSLTWDLGETRGTVALRMPEDETALELLRRTGPLAVSSANRHGKPAATSVLDAATQLGDAVEEYLDGGAARIGASSTILDATVTPAEIVREGAITKQQIIDVVGDIFTAPEPEPSEEEAEDAAGEQGEDGEPGTSTESAEGASDTAPAGEADGDAPSVLDLPSEPELE